MTVDGVEKAASSESCRLNISIEGACPANLVSFHSIFLATTSYTKVKKKKNLFCFRWPEKDFLVTDHDVNKIFFSLSWTEPPIFLAYLYVRCSFSMGELLHGHKPNETITCLKCLSFKVRGERGYIGCMENNLLMTETKYSMPSSLHELEIVWFAIFL